MGSKNKHNILNVNQILVNVDSIHNIVTIKNKSSINFHLIQYEDVIGLSFQSDEISLNLFYPVSQNDSINEFYDYIVNNYTDFIKKRRNITSEDIENGFSIRVEDHYINSLEFELSEYMFNSKSGTLTMTKNNEAIDFQFEIMLVIENMSKQTTPIYLDDLIEPLINRGYIPKSKLIDSK